MGVITTDIIINKIFTYIGMGILYLLTSILVVLRNTIISMVKFADKLYYYGKINYGICQVCYTKYQSPIYVCPNCKIGYNGLSPSAKGIFSIKCSCGKKLPVTSWGKRKLETLCTECKSEVTLAKVPIVAIPVIGGTKAGKTTFINNFNEQEANSTSTFKFMLFDTLASDFLNSDRLKKYKYYSYYDGLIFIIDPFVTAKLSREAIDEPKYMLNDILDTLILNFQKNYDLKPGETLNKPIAFVITKTDLLEQNQGIIDNNEENFLRKNGEEMFLNKIKRTFDCYKFFTQNEKIPEQHQKILSFIVPESRKSKHKLFWR